MVKYKNLLLSYKSKLMLATKEFLKFLSINTDIFLRTLCNAGNQYFVSWSRIISGFLTKSYKNIPITNMSIICSRSRVVCH